MPMFEPDSIVIAGIRDQLATMVSTYREHFAAREASKPGTVSLQKALSLPLSDEETVEIDELLDPIVALPYPEEAARCAVVFAHLSVKLAQLSEHFKEQASLFVSDLTDKTVDVMNDEDLSKLKKDCSDLFQKIIELCESPEAAGQPFTIKANGKGTMLKLPGFHTKSKGHSEKLSLWVGDKPDQLFIFNEERADPYINRAVDEAFSIKASEFLEVVPFRAMTSPVEYVHPHSGKTVFVQWIKED